MYSADLVVAYFGNAAPQRMIGGTSNMPKRFIASAFHQRGQFPTLPFASEVVGAALGNPLNDLDQKEAKQYLPPDSFIWRGNVIARSKVVCIRFGGSFSLPAFLIIHCSLSEDQAMAEVVEALTTYIEKLEGKVEDTCCQRSWKLFFGDNVFQFQCLVKTMLLLKHPSTI